MENIFFEYGIIGSGPAGYTAALRLGAQGKLVVIFEKEFIGGVCLNKGCIPTKTYLAAENFAQALENKEKNVQLLRRGLENSFKAAKVKVVSAEAKIISQNVIEAGGESFECRNIIVATGSKPRELKRFEFDGEFILSSDDILNLTTLPKKVLIVGSGAIGIEWTRIFSKFKVEVILVEIAPNLIPTADIEVSKRVERILKADGIEFFTSTSIEKIESKKVTLSNGENFNPDFIFIAAGREPLTGHESPLTSHEPPVTVHKLGDACGEIQLAHYAIHQAMEFTDTISFDKTLVPTIIYGEPEIASVGLREQDLESGTFNKISVPIRALSKAHCDGATEGFIKILSRENKIIGAHIVSKEASALIHQVLIAMQFGIGIDQLKEVCFAHPTYSEGIYEALLRL